MLLMVRNYSQQQKEKCGSCFSSIEDMVNKCLGRTPKSKKLKTVSKMDFDQDTGNSTAEIARPVSNKERENPSMKDFTIEKINLDAGSRVANVHHLEASTKKNNKQDMEGRKR